MMGLIGAGNNSMDGREIKKRKRIQMNLKRKYGNYELHPKMKITGYHRRIKTGGSGKTERKENMYSFL